MRKPTEKILLTVGLAVALLMSGGCETVKTTNAGAVGVNRKQQMLVSSETIDQGAAQAYETELKQARDKGTLNTDKAQLARVTNIAKRIVAVTPAFRPDAANWSWQFNVQQTKELNAYCMPGGRIMVYSGLIDSLDLSDAEIATVLGHEIAHALREHTRERVSRAYAQQLVLSGAAAVTAEGAIQFLIVATVFWLAAVAACLSGGLPPRALGAVPRPDRDRDRHRQTRRREAASRLEGPPGGRAQPDPAASPRGRRRR